MIPCKMCSCKSTKSKGKNVNNLLCRKKPSCYTLLCVFGTCVLYETRPQKKLHVKCLWINRIFMWICVRVMKFYEKCVNFSKESRGAQSILEAHNKQKNKKPKILRKKSTIPFACVKFSLFFACLLLSTWHTPKNTLFFFSFTDIFLVGFSTSFFFFLFWSNLNSSRLLF